LAGEGNAVPEQRRDEIEPDPRESRYELPPVEGRPFASRADKVQAIVRMLVQAERERAESAEG
jgi:hypothetical protein